MIIKRRTMSPAEQANLENAIAEIAKSVAKIDYIAMMADIDIPSEESAENEYEI